MANLPPLGLDLERRVRRIEDQIATKAVANPDLPLPTVTLDVPAPPVTDPPPISGLSLVSRIAKVSIRWNAAGIPDLRFYELQIADNVNFANATTVRTAQTNYTHNEGELGTEYWFKVRAVNITGRVGEFSQALSSVTGLVGTSDIDPNAISGTASFLSPSVVPFPGVGIAYNLALASLPTPALSDSAVQIWATALLQTSDWDPGGFSQPALDFDLRLYREGQLIDLQRLGRVSVSAPWSVFHLFHDATPVNAKAYSLRAFFHSIPNVAKPPLFRHRAMFLLELKR